MAWFGERYRSRCGGPPVEREATNPNWLEVLPPAFRALLDPLTAIHLIGLLSPDTELHQEYNLPR
jgi:hypothetical protein